VRIQLATVLDSIRRSCAVNEGQVLRYVDVIDGRSSRPARGVRVRSRSRTAGHDSSEEDAR
jgi:hypothetical protein